jgi:hypothetical protein
MRLKSILRLRFDNGVIISVARVGILMSMEIGWR